MESNRRGMALVLTLWILAALIVLAAGLASVARTEAQIARNFADIVRCRWAARSGINRAVAEAESLAKDATPLAGGGQLSVSSGEEGIDLGDAAFEVMIEDEAGKVNINTAPPESLETVLGSREVADCVIDWRDADDEPRGLGAETGHYASLRTPYRSRNAPFSTVRELLLVKGITEQMLSSPATEDGRTLEDILTVYSLDPNVAADGEERINIQSASKDQIKARLGDVLSDEEIDSIIKWRDSRKPGSAAEIALAPGIALEKVKAIYDRLTVSDAKVRPGRINVNTAPVEVLAALPGLDRAIAEEIVSRRAAQGIFEDVGRLLDMDAVSAEAFAKAADLLTTRSGVFRIVSTGRLARSRAAHSAVCVVDATAGQSAQIRYWRE